MMAAQTVANPGRKSTVSLGLYQGRHGIGGRGEQERENFQKLLVVVSLFPYRALN